MTTTMRDALSVAELRAALDEGRLEALYQPVYDLASRRMVAVEALARVRDHTGKLLAPALFLPTAERSGLVGRVDEAVTRTALHQVAAWRDTPGGAELAVAVNVSVRDLDDGTLPTRLASTVASAGLPFDAVIVEVTETVLSETGRGHEQVLTEVQALGCHVTLDDFGTGNATFAYLQRFPVAGIKVDRSFTAQLGTGNHQQHVTECLVRFGLDLGVHVVAEGIETRAQLAALQRLHCPFGQGYLLSRPVPADAIARLLADTPLPQPREGAA